MKDILKFIEEHPTLIAVCLFFLGGAGYLIKRVLFSDKKPSTPYIKAGRDISAGGDVIVGNKTINQSLTIANKNIEAFRKLIENTSWRKELIDHKEVWICDKDNTFQIEIGGGHHGEFREKWTQVYPDKANVSRYPVYLKINNTVVKEFTFISCDGGRIFVPLPELKSENNDNVIYVWHRDALPFKVASIIGRYYIHKNIEGVAQMSKIRII